MSINLYKSINLSEFEINAQKYVFLISDLYLHIGDCKTVSWVIGDCKTVSWYHRWVI